MTQAIPGPVGPGRGLDIPGVTLLEELGHGAHAVVWRGERNGAPVAVKVQRRIDDRKVDQGLRFRREGALLACLRHPALPRIEAVGESGGRSWIVIELVEGPTLAQRLSQGPLPRHAIVALAREMASALAVVHAHGIVHCDVKPDNVIVGAGERGARLIDFGLAVRASTLGRPDEVLGTPLYSPPEQTGMLKRPIDGRSDLYALGAMLYECATGVPPFSAPDAGELIRLHAVSVPAPVDTINTALSGGLSAIIAKLLAKDPDDRYQSNDSLLADLERLELLDSRPELRASLGSLGDVTTGAELDLPLTGRDEPLDTLVSAWKRASAGKGARGSVALVQGDSGLGKTRLLTELTRRVRALGGQAAGGACGQVATIPFGPLRDALDGLLRRRWLADDPSAIEARVRDAVGDAAPLLADFTAQLRAIVGDATEGMPEHEGLEDQFLDAMTDFLVRYARACGGLCLVIDDAHWLDGATASVLARLAPRAADEPLLLVVAARPDRGADDPVARALGISVRHTLLLGPLDDLSVGRLVASWLGTARAPTALARRIAARVAGSPLAAIEYVRSMLDGGMLVPLWGEWQVDDGGLAGLDLPTDVIDLVLRRLGDLDAEATGMLRVAAVLGSRFEADRLDAAVSEGVDEVQAALAQGVQARVVERRLDGAYSFVHNEVRDALLGALDTDALEDAHQRAASAWEAADAETPGRTYALARHCSAGRVAEDPARAVAANVAAGQLAIAEYAHKEGYDYLIAGRDLAVAHDLPVGADHEEALGHACALTGQLADAIAHFERTLEQTTDTLHRAKLRERLAHTHVANFHTVPAWEHALAGLAELGTPLPSNGIARVVSAGWYWLRGVISDRLGWGFGKLPRGDVGARERAAVYVKLTEHGAISAYFASRPLVLIEMVGRGLRAATRVGPSPELVTSYSQHGVGFALVGMHTRARRAVKRSLELAETLGDRVVLARSQLYAGFVEHMCGNAQTGQTKLWAALEEHGRWLDAMHWLDGSGDLVYNLLLRGYYRECWVWIERQLRRINFASGGETDKMGNPWAGPVLAALGRTSEAAAEQARTADFCTGAPRSERYLWGEMLSYRVLFMLEQGETGDAFDAVIDEHKTLGLRPLLTTFHMRSFFLFQAYARLEQAHATEGEVQKLRLKQLRAAISELKTAATIPALVAHERVIEAGYHRLRGNARKTRRMLDRATKLAEKGDAPWVHYEVARQRAFLLRTEGHAASAAREARVALGICHDQGWVQRARRLEVTFGLGRSASTVTRKSGTISGASASSNTATSHRYSLKLRRHLDALMEVSLAAASELDPQEQSRRALDAIVRILGAERGFLFEIDDGGRLVFQAGRDAAGEQLDAPTGFSTTVVETVRQRGEPMVLSGTDEGQALGSASVIAHDLRSIVAAPLTVRDSVVGVVYLDNRLARGVFTEDDTEILVAIANHIAVARETARAAQLEIQVEAESARRRLAESLADLSRALGATLAVSEVSARLAEGVRAVIPAAHCEIVLAADEPEPRIQRSVSEARPVLEVDGETAHLVVPIISKGDVAGVMLLERDAGTPYTQYDAGIALAFAGQAGVALDNARLFGEVQRLATTDELTGALNRRQFFTLGEREVKKAKRHERPLCAIMLDVDHFKKVNDTYGHKGGDDVLAEVARRISDSVRAVDVFGRYGGEEFAVIVPDTGLAATRDNVAERLRQVIAATPVASSAGQVTVTASLGVAELGPGEDMSAMLERADAALYEAKRSGRNRVVVAEGKA